MFAGNELALGIEDEAVASGFASIGRLSGVTGGFQPGLGSFSFVPADDAIVGNVREKDETTVGMRFFRNPDRAF